MANSITNMMYIDDFVKAFMSYSAICDRICNELCKYRDKACQSEVKEDIRDTICKDCFMYIERRDRKKKEK